MQLTYEPLDAVQVPASAGDVALVGIEAVRQAGSWPVLRHVFDVAAEAALYVEVDLLGGIEAYAVGYSFDGDESLTPL